MGAWSEASCGNDDCWDNLDADNIHKITQEESDKSIERAFNKLNNTNQGMETKIGVVIWCLRKGNTVAKYLDEAILFANELKDNQKYLNIWNRATVRRNQLVMEISEMEKAVASNGQGEKKHIPGLFEIFAKEMAK